MREGQLRLRGCIGVVASVALALTACGSSGGSDDQAAQGGGVGTQLLDARDGRKYPTKQFGAQLWMTANLAFGEVTTTYPRTDTASVPRYCPQTYPDPSDPTPCDLYGGYYSFATALALPRACNGEDCNAQVQSPHQGICPEGWHIPTKQDFEALASLIATESGLTANDDKGKYTQLGAAMRLNSACKTPPATEAQSSGFDGLPSGFANDTGYVSANGVWTFWQSTTQDEGYSYGWGMSCNDDRFSEGFYFKSHALPVRCVRN